MTCYVQRSKNDTSAGVSPETVSKRTAETIFKVPEVSFTNGGEIKAFSDIPGVESHHQQAGDVWVL